jgi:tetratricopeptide (TPR) repeat protein
MISAQFCGHGVNIWSLVTVAGGRGVALLAHGAYLPVILQGGTVPACSVAKEKSSLNSAGSRRPGICLTLAAAEKREQVAVFERRGTMSNHLDYEINKELGECYLFMGELDKAEEYYRKAAGSNGVHPDPYLGLATIAVQRGLFDDALVLYKKAADIEPGDKALAGMGLIEMERGENEPAFSHFAQALDMNPANMIAVHGLVQLGYVLGRIDDVIPRLHAFLEVDPAKDAVRVSLAGCYISVGRTEEAAGQLEELLRRDPANTAAQELYATLHR